MKILQLCNRVPFPLIDGGAIAMFAMTKSFADAGCEVHTLAINTKKHFVDISKIPDWFTQKTKLLTVEADTDVKVLGAIANLFCSVSYNLVRFNIPAFHQKLKELLKSNNYDVVQLEGLFLAQYIPTIRENSKAIISLRAHNVEYLIWERIASTTESPIKKWYINLLAKRLKKAEIAALNQVDCIVPISSVDEIIFRRMGANVPMWVCPGGVDESLLSLSHTDVEKKSLFHLAAMNWQPNVQSATWLMKKIWPVVKTKFPELKIYLAGKDMQQEFFEMQSAQVRVCGRLDNAHEFMLSKNIMLVPLLSGSGMRIKIIEGLALGKVIVSTRIGAEGIDCIHKKDILIADTAEEFASAIELALIDKSLCAEISANAKVLVKQKYTNTLLVQRLIGFYNQQLSFNSNN